MSKADEERKPKIIPVDQAYPRSYTDASGLLCTLLTLIFLFLYFNKTQTTIRTLFRPDWLIFFDKQYWKQSRYHDSTAVADARRRMLALNPVLTCYRTPHPYAHIFSRFMHIKVTRSSAHINAYMGCITVFFCKRGAPRTCDSGSGGKNSLQHPLCNYMY